MSRASNRFTRARRKSGNRQQRTRILDGKRLCVQVLEDRRLLAAGALDFTFGVNGIQVTEVPGGFVHEQARNVAIQSDGKIVVAGFDSDSPFGEATLDGNFIVVRYLTDGLLDPTFGPGGADGNGVVSVDFAGGADGAFSLAIQPDGKIIAAGFAFTGLTRDFGLVRLNTDGSLDTGFGNGGKVTTDFGFATDTAQAVVIQPDGKIVAGGPVTNFTLGFQAAPKYTVTDIGTLGGPSAEAYDINSAGQVVGVSALSTGQGRHAYRTAAEAPVNSASDDLGTLGGASSFARGINQLGQAVGFSQFDPTSIDRTLVHAFRTGPGLPINPATDDLGTLGGASSTGFAINNAGQVVGHSAIAPGSMVEHAFRWKDTNENGRSDPGEMIDLGSFGGTLTEAHDINDAGVVVGFSFLTGDGSRHAFRTTPNGLINAGSDLGVRGGTNSAANGVNQAGFVVGAFETTPGSEAAHGFVLPPGAPSLAQAIDIGTLPGTLFGVANAINEAGWVVGFSGNDRLADDPERHAWLWRDVNGNGQTDPGDLLDLNDIIPPGSGLIIREALSINQFNEIVGLALPQGGNPRTDLRAIRLRIAALDYGVARYNIDGSLDPTFGTGGKATVDFNSFDDTIRNITLQPDGKVLATGLISNPDGSTNIGLIRLTTGGALDATFGTGGIVSTDFGEGQDEAANAIFVDPLGNIVVAGTAVRPNAVPANRQADFAVARYNSAGALDPTFDGDGRVLFDFDFDADSAGNDVAYGAALQQDGRIVVAGLAGVPSPPGMFNGDIGVVRFDSLGQVDTSFGNDGQTRTDVGGGGLNEVFDMVLDRNGDIVVAGFAPFGAHQNPFDDNNNLVVARYDGTKVNLMVGGISEYALPAPAAGSTQPASHPAAMVIGPDNRIWTTDPFAFIAPGAAGTPLAGRLAAFDVSTQTFTEFDLPLPALVSASIQTLTSAGGTATATTTAPHGFAPDSQVTIRGARETEYNGAFFITVTGANTFTYAISGTPASPATGNITAGIEILFTPHAITVGPDDNLWFTAFTPPIPGPHRDMMGAFSPEFAFDNNPATEPFLGWFDVGFVPDPIATPLAKKYPHIPIADPRGGPYVYFTEMGTPFDREPDKVGRMARINVETGVVQEFGDLLVGTNPHSLTADNGADGMPNTADDNLWVAFRGSDQVARFNLDTQPGTAATGFDKFVQFPANSGPNDVKYSPFDDKFYVALQDSSEIGSFTYNHATQTAGPATTIDAFLSPSENVVVGNVIIGPEGRSIWYVGTIEQPLIDVNPMDGIADTPPEERIGRLDLDANRDGVPDATPVVTEFKTGLVPTVDPIEVIVGPDANIWFTETNPGWLAPPAINPNPGKLGRLVPARAEEFGNGGGSPNGSILWGELITSAFLPPQVDIFVMNPDGSGQTNLTNFPGSDVWGAWSPDGTKIAFTSDRDGNFEIYVMNYDGTNQTRLTDDTMVAGAKPYDYQPTWSPDGTKIAFTRIVDTGEGINADIWVLELRVVVNPIIPGSGNEFDPFRAHLDVVSMTQVTSDPGDDLEPTWSPDGTKIVFTSDRDGNFEIYTMNADGSGQTNITNNPFADSEADWSPDLDPGTPGYQGKFVFTSNRTGGTPPAMGPANGEIFVMNLDGSGVTRLTFDPGTDLGPAWSPDGQKIVFTGVPFGMSGFDEIFTMDAADGQNRTRLTVNATGDFLSDWQPLLVSPTLPLPASFDLAFIPPSGAPPVVASFSAGAVEEPGNGPGRGAIVFPVFLRNASDLRVPQASEQIVTVSFLTNDAVPNLAAPFATATPLQDYIPRSGLLIFRPGETQKLPDPVTRTGGIVVPLIPDGPGETNEVFTTVFFLPTNATVAETIPDTIRPGNPGFGKITNQALAAPETGVTIREFEISADQFNPADFAHGGGMTVAPDDAFWLSAQFDNKLTRFVFDPVSGTGTSVDFPLEEIPGLPGSEYAAMGLTGVFPHFLTIARDGRYLWGTGLNDVIFRVDLTDLVAPLTVKYFRTGITAGSTPHGILQDPSDEDIFWFAEESEEIFPEPGGGNKSEEGQSRLGRLQVSTEQVDEFVGGLGVGARMHGFNFDPQNGNIWVGLEGPDQVARFDRTTEQFTDFVQFPRGTGPHALYQGPPGDTKLYVVLQDSNQIGVFNPATKQIERIVSIPGLRVDIPFGSDEGTGDGSSIVQFVPSADGRYLYFTEFLNDRVGRMNLQTYQVEEFWTGITPNAAPLNIVVGPDDNIWFSGPMLDRSQRGRISQLTTTEVDTPLKITVEASETPFGTSITTNNDGTFWVNVYVEDLRGVPEGVVGGAIDLLFQTLNLDPTGAKQYGSAFTLNQQGTANDAGGFIDETGALTSASGIGAGSRGAFVAWEFRVTTVGSVTFNADPGEGTGTITPAEFALVGLTDGVPWTSVEFVGATVNATAVGKGGDFDGDGDVDQVDLNLLIGKLFIPQSDSRYEAKFDLTGNGPVNHYDLGLEIHNVAVAATSLAVEAPIALASASQTESEPAASEAPAALMAEAAPPLEEEEITSAVSTVSYDAAPASEAAAPVSESATIDSHPAEAIAVSRPLASSAAKSTRSATTTTSAATAQRQDAALTALAEEDLATAATMAEVEAAVASDAALAAATGDIDAQQVALLEVLLEVSSTPFGPAVTTLPNGTFWLNVYVEDLRDTPEGVVGGALDLLFNTTSLMPTGNVEYGEFFTEFQQGTPDDDGGIIDEAGALTTGNEVGAGERADFVAFEFQTTTSAAIGNVTFSAEPGEGTDTITPAEFALVNLEDGVPWDDVDFVDATVNLTVEGEGVISGVVYVDTSGNHLFDSSESPLRGVTITLSGAGGLERTTTTDSAGAYRFENLAAATYEVRERHPIAFFDGEDQIGTAGGTVADDHFSGIVLTAGATSSGNNFGETGIRPEYFSRRMFLASSPPFVESLAALVQLGEQSATASSSESALKAEVEALSPEVGGDEGEFGP